MYAGQAEFEISRVDMVGNTGTYLDSPFHRYAGRPSIGELPLDALVGLQGRCVDAVPRADGRAVDVRLGTDQAPPAAPGTRTAILVRTGWDRRWGTPAYWEPGPYLSEQALDALIAAGPGLVGVDFWNVDDTTDPSRPAHTRLLEAGILIVEHLAGLEALPADGFRLFAVPPPVVGASSFPVRAFAEVADAVPRADVETFETERLVARPIAQDDFAVLSLLHHDERVMATLGGIRSDEQTRAFLDHKTGHWARFGYGMWMFNHRATGEFVGRGGLQKIVIGGNLEIEVGYTLRADYFGQGYGTEMARGIVDVATRELGLSDLVAFTLPDNAASRRVMEKSGFAYERTLMHEGEEHVLYRLVPAAGTTAANGTVRSMDNEVEALFAEADPAVRQVAEAARALVRDALPGLIEMVDRPANMVAYGQDGSYRGLVCAIALQRRYVNLMLARGATLPDPDGLLEGSGKQARHVRLASVADVGRPEVRALLVRAGTPHPQAPGPDPDP